MINSSSMALLLLQALPCLIGQSRARFKASPDSQSEEMRVYTFRGVEGTISSGDKDYGFIEMRSHNDVYNQSTTVTSAV